MVLASVLLPGACGGVPRPDQPPEVRQVQDPVIAEAMGRIEPLRRQGRHAEAVPLLRTVVEREPEFVPAHLWYQDSAIALGGETERRMRDHYRDLRGRPGSPVADYLRARLRSESPFLQREALEAILRQHQSFAYAHLSMGRLQRAHGHLAAAADHLQRAVALDPGLAEAHLDLAETLVDLGRHEQAAVHYDRYVRARPDDLERVRGYVQLLVYRLSRGDLAIHWIDTALLAADPDDAGALMDKAAALWRAQNGREREAVDLYRRVLGRDPENARAVLNLGLLYYDVLAVDEASRARWWPKARTAFRLYQELVQPEEPLDHLETSLAVPFRLKAIAAAGLPDDGGPPRVEDLLRDP